jgi:hypothetical protein
MFLNTLRPMKSTNDSIASLVSGIEQNPLELYEAVFIMDNEYISLCEAYDTKREFELLTEAAPNTTPPSDKPAEATPAAKPADNAKTEEDFNISKQNFIKKLFETITRVLANIKRKLLQWADVYGKFANNNKGAILKAKIEDDVTVKEFNAPSASSTDMDAVNELSKNLSDIQNKPDFKININELRSKFLTSGHIKIEGGKTEVSASEFANAVRKYNVSLVKDVKLKDINRNNHLNVLTQVTASINEMKSTESKLRAAISGGKKGDSKEVFANLKAATYFALEILHIGMNETLFVANNSLIILKTVLKHAK